MNKDQQRSVQTYLENNARPIDLALFDFHFRDGSAQAVIDELSKYQNADGGFGNAIEPDLRLPQSTALATWMAFRIMNEVNADIGNEVLQRGLDYLLHSYDKARTGWAIVRPEVDNFPHAPWWDYKTATADFGWGNPSAELLGFLIKYSDGSTADIIASLTQKALERIQEVESSHFHEVFNFKALYELANEDLQKQLKQPLEQLLIGAVSTDPGEWAGYVATPLRFISSPTDPFAHLFDEDILHKNLEFLQSNMVGENHWEPNWDWAGTYPDDWLIAKKEWSGQLTVKNLVTLRSFGTL